MSSHRKISISPPLARLLESCEVHCLAACCQDNAFDCGVEQVSLWVRQVEASTARDAREQTSTVLREIKSDDATPIYTELFMATWQPSELTKVLREVETSLKAVEANPQETEKA